MVERYRCFGWDIRRGEMRPRGDGEWVLYSDYESLERQLAEALAARDELRALTKRFDRYVVSGEMDASDRAEAAEAERDRLAADNARLREALEPFAQVAEYDIGESEGDGDIYRHMDAKYAVARLPRVGDFRRARAALPGKE